MWNSKHIRGCSALNFQRGKTVKALLVITDLLTFLVCKSSTNRPREAAFMQVSEPLGYAASSTSKRLLS